MSSATERPLRPIPALDSENEFFWTSGADGLLRVLRCGSCGYFIHPPRPLCPMCLSWEVEPQVLSGRGRVESLTINHREWNPNVPPPYVIARVELDEQPGLYVITNIVGTDPANVSFGQHVSVVFEQVSEDVFLPLFEPAVEG